MRFRLSNKILGYTAILLVGYSNVCRSQSWSAKVNFGIATYSLNDMHDYQDYQLSLVPVKATKTQEFPPYSTYSINIGKDFGNYWNLGVEYGHGSTGGRIYYADYSGELILDQLYSYNYFGFTPSYNVYNKNDLRISLGMKLLVVLNTIKIRNTVTIAGQTQFENPDFGATNLSFQPNISFRKSFHNFFVSSSCGYEIQTQTGLRMKGNSDVFLAGKDNHEVAVSAGGLRADLGVGFLF